MGNRQGGKMTPRQDQPCQHKPRKHGARQEGFPMEVGRLSPGLRAALQSMDARCAGSVVTSPMSALHPHNGPGHTVHGSPSFVTRVGQEEKHMMSCVPGDRGPQEVWDDGGNSLDRACSQKLFHPNFLGYRNVLKDSNLHNHQDFSKGQSVVSDVFFDSYSSVPPFLKDSMKHRCLEPDPLTKVTDGVNPSTAVTNLAAACIQRLEHLKRNIEQCNTENVTHFNNTGFAQLQCEAGYGDYDNADDSKVSDACEQGADTRVSPNTVVMTGVLHIDDSAQSKAVRKLSEPGQLVVRKDSMSSKAIIPSTWSKSAENSPLIVRKALPSPSSPLVVQRTPSQSPSVERRFPANSSSSCAGPWHANQSVDGQQSKQRVCQQLPSKDASLNIRQKTAAEISLPHLSTSPISFRKMPESPVLLSSGIHRQRKVSGNEPASSDADLTPGEKTYQVHCLKPLTLSSCSSSSSECPQRSVSSPEDRVSPFIPLCITSSTSHPSATLSSASPTPITFCPQPKGTPIRTCTMVSQPSTAVFLSSRESQDSLQMKGEAMSQMKDTDTGGQSNRDRHAAITSSHKQTSSSVVTEDTIKQNSQSAVFGSVSPKLLRHRRLTKENLNPPHNEHTFPKQSQCTHIVTAKTFPYTRGQLPLGIGDTICTNDPEHGHTDGDDMFVQLSQSAPSAFPTQASDISVSCAGNKTLGQRIREVINEGTAGAYVTRETSSVLVKTHRKRFSKDDIFTGLSNPDKIAWYSYTNNYANKSQNLKYEKIRPSQNEHQIHVTRKGYGKNTEEDAKDITRDIQFPKSSSHSHRFRDSSRDSCSSCVSDCSHTELYDSGVCQGRVAELTQANVCQQSELWSGGAGCGQQGGGGTQRGKVHPHMATSDTSDTLSTDRDTSGSSKRESSTSTATDDTLTSFQTRSTADSADYDDFVLPRSLVFTRSADRDAQDDTFGFESEQTTIKRKLVHGQSHGARADHEPLSYKTRKKRRKQVKVQSLIVTATQKPTEDTLTRKQHVRQVHSEALSDDSDTFGSKEDVSDLLSSRDNISDLPSSRDDISDLPSSRDDISDLPSSRDDISDLPSSRDDISDCTRAKGKVTGGCVNKGVVTQLVFHRSDLQSSTPPVTGPVDDEWSVVSQAATDTDFHTFTTLSDTATDFHTFTTLSDTDTDYHTPTALSDTDSHCTFNRRRFSNKDPHGSFLDVSQMPSHTEGPGRVPPRQHDQSGDQCKDTHPEEVLRAHSVLTSTGKRVTAAPLVGTTLAEDAEDQHTRRQPAHLASVGTGQGTQLLHPGLHSPESRNAAVLSYTIYNSACHDIHSGD